MKEFLAVVAAALAVFVAYTFHQDRLRTAAGASVGKATQMYRPLSVELDHYSKGLVAKLDTEYAENFVPPLETIKALVITKQQSGDPAKKPIYDAGLRTLERLIPIAQQRTSTLEAVLKIASRPASTLDRTDSSNTANAFFQQNIVKRWEADSAQRRALVDLAMAQLRDVEGQVRMRLGDTAANDDFVPRRFGHSNVSLENSATMNPLDRGSYDRRESQSSRDKQSQQNSGTTSSQ